MAKAPDKKPKAAPSKDGKAGSSAVGLMAGMALLTVIATAAGGGFGAFLGTLAPRPTSSGAAAPDIPLLPGLSETSGIRALQPIVANLAEPRTSWVRLEANLIVEGEGSVGMPLLTGKITEDIIAYLRTLTATQLEGPSALQHLRDDLNERVRVRSGGKAKEILIHTLVVE